MEFRLGSRRNGYDDALKNGEARKIERLDQVTEDWYDCIPYSTGEAVSGDGSKENPYVWFDIECYVEDFMRIPIEERNTENEFFN